MLDMAVTGAEMAMQVNMMGTMCMLLPAIHIINMFIISDRPCPMAISIAICDAVVTHGDDEFSACSGTHTPPGSQKAAA